MKSAMNSQPTTHEPNDDDYAMQLMNELDIPDDVDVDITSCFADDSLDESLDQDFTGLFNFEENPNECRANHHGTSTAPIVNQVKNESYMGNQGGCNHFDGSAFYDTREYVDSTTQDFQDQSSNDDMSISSSSAEQTPTADLDAQIQKSMSKLVKSMHMSEISRNMLGRQQESMGIFGIGSFLNNISQSKSQLNSYMSQVGNNSMM